MFTNDDDARNFLCAFCGDIKPRDDQAPDECKKPCCWKCKREMEPHP